MDIRILDAASLFGRVVILMDVDGTKHQVMLAPADVLATAKRMTQAAKKASKGGAA